MKPEFMRARTATVALVSGLVSLFVACGGDDTGVSTGTGGASGTGGTSDASMGRGGGTGGVGGGGVGEAGGSAGVGGTGGARADAGVVSDAAAAAEEAAPFVTQTLFDFVPADAGGMTLGWLPVPATAGSTVGVVDDDQAPTSPTAGALEFRGVFPPPDQTGFSSMSLEVNYGDPTTGVRDLTGASNIHFWVRIVSPPGLLRAFQPFVQGGALSSYSGTYQPYVTTFDDTWHEYVIPVAGQFYLSGVWKLGIQFFAPNVPVPVDASIVEGGGGDGQAEAGSLGDENVDARVVDAGDARAATDADAGAATDADARVSGDSAAATDADGNTDAGHDGGTQDADISRPSVIVVHVDYVWVN